MCYYLLGLSIISVAFPKIGTVGGPGIKLISLAVSLSLLYNSTPMQNKIKPTSRHIRNINEKPMILGFFGFLCYGFMFNIVIVLVG